jgi:N-sulfoglucosamine sulfohydrolase
MERGRRPNILYLHSHDTGRWVQPYGYPVRTPNIARLADQGIVFRHAYSAAPVCSGSRAALLTGEYCHQNGMMGLAHRGFALHDVSRHLVHTLRAAGYWSGLVGEDHVSKDPGSIGYDHVVDLSGSNVATVVPAAIDLLSRPRDAPFFLSVGFFETHRDYFEPTSVHEALYSLPPSNIPETPETRRDMAAFKDSVATLDMGVGRVLDALDREGLGDDTLVVFTTDHGIPFPGAKATLSDRGLGVLMIARGPGGFDGGTVQDALISHLDVFPTFCDVAGAQHPPWLQGRSMLPLVRGEAQEIRDELFAEITYHAAYEPQRGIRTRRWKYIRRFDDFPGPVLPNVDDSPSKDLLVEYGWRDHPVAREQLYDLVFDPGEAANLVDEPARDEVLGSLRDRLERWMRETADPLLDGPVELPPGAVTNLQDQTSPADTTFNGVRT